MIQIDNLSFGYHRESLFTDTSLKLGPGNIYGLLGLNGAGKSSLLRLMSGLLFPAGGQVDVLGYEPAKRQPDFLSKIFVLPENIVVPNLTGKEYVSIQSPFYLNFDVAQMEQNLDRFEIPQDRKLPALSHGQQKKFLLSFGLACNAEFLILDEPTNGLDIPSKGLFRRLVAESLTEEQTFIVSTHQVHDLESLIDSIIILYEGRILFNQGLDEVSSQLRMSTTSERPGPDPDLLYCERTIGGFANLWSDPDGSENQIDLELLFKSVIANPEIFSSLFAGRSTQ